jgi:hypothetical protein
MAHSMEVAEPLHPITVSMLSADGVVTHADLSSQAVKQLAHVM